MKPAAGSLQPAACSLQPAAGMLWSCPRSHVFHPSTRGCGATNSTAPGRLRRPSQAPSHLHLSTPSLNSISTKSHLDLTASGYRATLAPGRGDLRACARAMSSLVQVREKDFPTSASFHSPDAVESRQPSTPQREEVEVKLLKFIQQRDGGGTAPR